MRLIDADALDDVVTRLNAENWGITVSDYKIIDRVLFEFPTVDTPTNTPNTPTNTPIVRCGECEHRHKDKWGWYCDNDSADPYERTRSVEDDDWFCADGERREDEAD